MKRVTILLVVVFMLLGAYACFAQGSPGSAPMPGSNPPVGGGAGGMQCNMPGMMGGMQGMSGGMTGMGMDSGMQMWSTIVQRLGLTNDQQRRITLIFLDFVKTQASVNGQVQADMISIAQTMLSDRPEKSKVDAAVREINRLQGDQMLAGVNAIFAAKDVLTPEQWKTFQSMAPSLMASGSHPGQMGGMRGMGQGMCPMCGGMGQGMGGMGQGMGMPPMGNKAPSK